MRKLALALLVAVSACAPKVVPAPVVTMPRFPDFLQPQLPPEAAGTPAATLYNRGWAFLQSGDPKTAEREFSAVLTLTPSLYQAETSLGYVELARKDAKAALPHFDRAVEKNANAAPALVGRAQALTALNREGEALQAFEGALAADPSLVDIGRRIEVLRFRSAERDIARARQLARQGHADEAAQAYKAAIAGSPESPFLYRELAAIERQRGNPDAALANFRKAIDLDPADARSMEQIGETLEGQGDLEGAEKAYGNSLAVEANADVEGRLERVRDRIELSHLPSEYRAIDDAPQITRGDLAALIGVRLASLLQSDRRRDAALITDVRNHWAAAWIVAVARAGIMEPFANHAFQPRAVVHRTELAQIAARVLTRIAALTPGGARQWESARLKFSDLPPTHLAYSAASIAVASGVMQTGADSAFQPTRLVTGAEAIEAIGRLEALARLPGTPKSNNR